jgi:hypothetical protein
MIYAKYNFAKQFIVSNRHFRYGHRNPNRHIKEGFATVVVLTSDGKLHTGYERATRRSAANGDLVIQDVSSKELVTIKKKEIGEKRIAASVMPEGLTAVLAEDQLLHLIKYLTELGRIQ